MFVNTTGEKARENTEQLIPPLSSSPAKPNYRSHDSIPHPLVHPSRTNTITRQTLRGIQGNKPFSFVYCHRLQSPPLRCGCWAAPFPYIFATLRLYRPWHTMRSLSLTTLCIYLSGVVVADHGPRVVLRTPQLLKLIVIARTRLHARWQVVLKATDKTTPFVCRIPSHIYILL